MDKKILIGLTLIAVYGTIIFCYATIEPVETTEHEREEVHSHEHEHHTEHLDEARDEIVELFHKIQEAHNKMREGAELPEIFTENLETALANTATLVT